MNAESESIPFLLMRGGTSRGPCFRGEDLPKDRGGLARVLMGAVGAGHPLNIDGVGGGASVTAKVVIISESRAADSDIDYLFAQVGVEDRQVDFSPTCGNMLSCVGPAAIEFGMVTPRADLTDVRIRAVNTEARVTARVQTPAGRLTYAGSAEIAGVPGSAAPVRLSFTGTVGSQTGSMFPTGRRKDRIEGTEATCIDVAVPLLLLRASDFGVTGLETPAELNGRADLLARLEKCRREAGRRMGLGDVADKVTPKVGIVAPPAAGGMASVRYFTPRSCHPSLAVTGAQGVAASLVCSGTVAEDLHLPAAAGPLSTILEHPSGLLELTLDYVRQGEDVLLNSATVMRTARKIVEGRIFLPA